jgi:hypothetical protein
LIKEPLYHDQELITLSGNPSGYTLRPYKINKKSVSCKIARDGNFDSAVRPKGYKINDGKILFVNYFKSVPLDSLEKIYE